MTEWKMDPKTELQMKALVEQLSAYIETFYGGSAEYVSFDGKVLKVRLAAPAWVARFPRPRYMAGWKGRCVSSSPV